MAWMKAFRKLNIYFKNSLCVLSSTYPAPPLAKTAAFLPIENPLERQDGALVQIADGL